MKVTEKKNSSNKRLKYTVSLFHCFVYDGKSLISICYSYSICNK